MPIAPEQTVTTPPLTIQDRIAASPEEPEARLNALEILLQEQEGNVKAVKDEITITRRAIKENMNPDEKLLAEISDRYSVSTVYGVDRTDFDKALRTIGKDANALGKLHRLKAAGAEMAIVSVDESEIVFMDTVLNVKVEEQEKYLSGLPKQERLDAIENLREEFPTIDNFLQRSASERGLNYYDALLLCKITGAELMSENRYRESQDRKPVDLQTISWLLTDKKILDRGSALNGGRPNDLPCVGEGRAGDRFALRGVRVQLRVQVSSSAYPSSAKVGIGEVPALSP